MLGPSRPLPRVGASAHIKHFGGSSERVTVVSIDDEGRRLCVRGEDDDLYAFVLSPSSARFVSADSVHGPRLDLAG